MYMIYTDVGESYFFLLFSQQKLHVSFRQSVDMTIYVLYFLPK